MAAWHWRGAAILVVAACHVAALAAFARVEQGHGVPPRHRNDAFASSAPVAWATLLAAPLPSASASPRDAATGRVNPASDAVGPASPAISASAVAPGSAGTLRVLALGAATFLDTSAAQEPTADVRNGPAFIAADKLDVRPVAVSEPDIGHLETGSVSGLPVVLRVFVGASGRVARVDVLAARDEDIAFVAALQSMLEATLFLPGKIAGADVAAFFDVTLGTVASPQSGS